MIKDPEIEGWHKLAEQEGLTHEQLKLFERYSNLLLSWNEKMNLTAITDLSHVIDYHFRDSLQVHTIVDIKKIMHCADIGSGGGCPGIPLAIKYPHLSVTLIEVNTKKIVFLNAVITELQLGDRVQIFEQDWRTFLKTTKKNIQLFCARASLKPEELIRMFKPSCIYKKAQLVYWASDTWLSSAVVLPYIVEDVLYKIRNKKRRYILLQDHNT